MPLLMTENKEERFDLYRSITRIGSSASSDIVLNADNIAQDHAHITRDGDNYTIASLGRGKTVLVNGKKTKKTTLNDGDSVQIGDRVLHFLTSALVESDVNNPSDKSVLEAYQEIVNFSEQLMRSSTPPVFSRLGSHVADNVVPESLWTSTTA